jgi:hypothetical protein
VKDCLIVDSEGRAWLESMVNGVRKSSYLGFLEVVDLETWAKARGLDFKKQPNRLRKPIHSERERISRP